MALGVAMGLFPIGPAHGQIPEPARSSGLKVVLLPVRTQGLPSGTASLVNAALRDHLANRGCVLPEDKAVAAMQKLLGLKPGAKANDLRRLGRSLLSDQVLAPQLAREGKRLRVEVRTIIVSTDEERTRGDLVEPEDMLPSLMRLSGLVLGLDADKPETPPAEAGEPGMPAPAPAPTEPGTPTRPPGAEPPRPAPGLTPASPSSADPAAPPSEPGPEPPPSTSPAPPIATPPPVPASQRPVPARGTRSTAGRASAPPSATVSATAPSLIDRPRFMAATGLRVFHVFGSEQVGPALDVELGVLQRNYRLAGLYRAYFGEVTSHLLGMRFEGGPRWGRVRLSIGLDLGLVLTPDRGTVLDMLTIGAELAGLTVQLWHMELHLNAFALDMYLVLADAEGEIDIEPWFGFNSGLSAAFFF